MNTLVESKSDAAVEAHGHGDEHHDKPHYDDVNVPSVVVLGVVSGLVTFISIVFVQGLYYQWEASQIEVKEYGKPVAAAKVIALQKESLTGYLEAKDGAYKKSIPIERAMTLVVDELGQKSGQNEKGAEAEKKSVSQDAHAPKIEEVDASKDETSSKSSAADDSATADDEKKSPEPESPKPDDAKVEEKPADEKSAAEGSK